MSYSAHLPMWLLQFREVATESDNNVNGQGSLAWYGWFVQVNQTRPWLRTMVWTQQCKRRGRIARDDIAESEWLLRIITASTRDECSGCTGRDKPRILTRTMSGALPQQCRIA